MASLNGNDGDDILIGGSANDTLNGGVGNDFLDGGDGVHLTCQLTAGRDDDTFFGFGSQLAGETLSPVPATTAWRSSASTTRETITLGAVVGRLELDYDGPASRRSTSPGSTSCCSA